ncbi:MAG: 4Fe-4S dicluster domain-containing protein [Acidobacteria bacterium]|nr:4Fe-4S dicluster domain-containing protein [Acidobacteriota bacterium]
MPKRQIIEIDRDKCNGCGLCTDACAEGALVLDDENKAVLAKEIFCDGLGACLDVCPVDALHIVERESEDYDPQEAYKHVLKTRGKDAAAKKEVSGQSELSQWPVQLHLISPYAPYFNESDLLIAADCTAFSFGSFHQDLLKGKKLVIACPKLDDTSNYIHKLAELLKNNTIYSLTVAIMQVPCCTGLMHIVQKAVEESGTRIPIKKIVVGIDGAIIS